jgi:acetyltransferase-like isoleucine patch superfamily enzyme
MHVPQRKHHLYQDAGTPAPNGSDRIKFGHHCVLGSKCSVTPPAVVKVDGTTILTPPEFGSFVHIGSNVGISALAIGSHVLIGDDAILGNRVDVKSCVVVTSGSVVRGLSPLQSCMDAHFIACCDIGFCRYLLTVSGFCGFWFVACWLLFLAFRD